MDLKEPPPWPYEWIALGAAVAIAIIVLLWGALELGERIWP